MSEVFKIADSPRRPSIAAAVVILFIVSMVAIWAVVSQADDAKLNRPQSGKSPRKSEQQVTVSRSSKSKPLEKPEIAGFKPNKSGYDVLVDKPSRKMTIFLGGKPIKSYRVFLGFNPDGEKTRRGDGCTPVGDYYICRRNAGSAYNRSLLISYPSPKDAEKGVEDGLVALGTLGNVVSAYRAGSVPPQDTRLGGNICIHGEGGRRRPSKDWTAGCVAVTNEEIEEVFALVPTGTSVTIRG